MRMPLTSTPTKRRWWPGPGSGGSGGELAKETTPNVGRGASGANGADGTRTGNGAIGAIGVGSGADAGSGTGTCTGDAASGAGTGTCDEAIGTGTGGCSDTDAGTGMGDESREAAAPSADGHSTSVRRTEKRFWTGTGTDETEKEDDGDKDGTDKEEKNVAPGLRGPVGKSKRRRPAIDVAIKKDAGPRTCPAPNGGWDSPWPCGRARHRYCKLSGRPPRWTGAHVGASTLCRQASSSKITNRRENNNVHLLFKDASLGHISR